MGMPCNIIAFSRRDSSVRMQIRVSYHGNKETDKVVDTCDLLPGFPPVFSSSSALTSSSSDPYLRLPKYIHHETESVLDIRPVYRKFRRSCKRTLPSLDAASLSE